MNRRRFGRSIAARPPDEAGGGVMVDRWDPLARLERFKADLEAGHFPFARLPEERRSRLIRVVERDIEGVKRRRALRDFFADRRNVG